MWWWPRRFISGADGSPDTSDNELAVNASRRMEPGAGIVQQAGRWGFSPRIAQQVVRGHSWNDLVSAWRCSDRALSAARTNERALALVVLRAAILDEMESQDSAALREFLTAQSRRRSKR